MDVFILFFKKASVTCDLYEFESYRRYIYTETHYWWDKTKKALIIKPHFLHTDYSGTIDF